MAAQTLPDLMKKLHAQGYTAVCRSEEEGLRFAPDNVVFAPEELRVDGVFRLEGTSAPDESVVLFAVQSPDGQCKGTFTSAHGVDSDPLDADAMQRLQVPAHLTGSSSTQPEQRA